MFDDQQPKQTTPPGNLPTDPEDIFAGVDGATASPSAPGSLAGQELPTALSAGVLKPKVAAPITAMPELPDTSLAEAPTPMSQAWESGSPMRGPVIGKIILVILIILGLGALGFLGLWIYGRYNNRPSIPAEMVKENTPAAPEPAPAEPPSTEPIIPPPATSTEAVIENRNNAILFGEQTDSDKDDLNDSQERNTGTDPFNPDTDGDGLSDGDEVNQYKSDASKADTDGDGLNDGDEALIWHTDPKNPDTDGDGHVDGKEVFNGYNPLGPGKLFNVPGGATSTPRSK